MCVYARMIVCVCVGEYAHTVVWQGRSVCVWKVSAVRECVCVCVSVCVSVSVSEAISVLLCVCVCGCACVNA